MKGDAPQPTTTRRDLLALGAICAVAFFFGLTDHGVTNWQEAVRLAAAQEMAAADDWLVPTIHGQAYLAKPPLIYWCQLAIAEIRGAPIPTLFDLRLTVALAGLVSVIGIYFLGRSLFADRPKPSRPAFWSAAFLATAVLFVRNARIGELDILIVPASVLAVGGIWLAWKSHLDRCTTSWSGIGLAMLGFALAALAKGPPAVITPILAGYGGILLHQITRHPVPIGGSQLAPRLFAAAAAGAAFLAFREVRDTNDAIGALFFAVSAGSLAGLLPRLFGRGVGCEIFVAYSRTHPVGALLIAGLTLWLWTASMDPEITAEAARRETGENLKILVLAAPVRTLEFIGYAAGLGSVTAIAGFFWLGFGRPRITPGMWIAIAWAVLPLIAFSTLGKGVQRYLVPTLPGLCLVGGLWFDQLLSQLKGRSPPATTAAGVLITILALGQGWWYGIERDNRFAHRSPRDFFASLARPELGVDNTRIASLDLWTPAFDVYAEAPVKPYHEIDTSFDYPHRVPRIEDMLAPLTRGSEPLVVLIRDGANPTRLDQPTAIERLEQHPLTQELGLAIEPMAIDADFRVDKFRTPIRAVRLIPLPSID
ncbi:MAG: glycosyltransferase family 39 protein [Planctomycetota bacterium]